MSWVRRILLELWAIFMIALAVGFMGPFGTYLNSTIMDRVGKWWSLLLGAYLVVRPCIALLQRFARATALPEKAVVLWGVIAVSVPLARLWRAVGQDAYRELHGYTELIPFSLLCGLAVLASTAWAAGAESRLAAREPDLLKQFDPAAAGRGAHDDLHRKPDPISAEPKLQTRLSPAFQGPIVALESEDHYVRVHGMHTTELLLMRLREAISEMNGVEGEQIHRSWWVAKSGIDRAQRSGRNWAVRLVNGETAPVSRDAVYRLQRSGLLPLGEDHPHNAPV